MKEKQKQAAIPALLERYELKFVIPERLIEPISNFASAYCSLDKYSEITPGNFYRVNNLYFDTPNYLFLKNRIEKTENRFNMRVRSYGDNPVKPYFLEIKQKKGNIIKKYRAKVYDEDWYKNFERQEYEDNDVNDKEIAYKNLFFYTALKYNTEPKILTQYLRKAYISDIDDYGRVTFDIGLRYQVENGYNLIPDDNKMVPYDFSTIFDGDANVILELKCYTSHVPFWMLDLIRKFDLNRRSFSKYMNGVTQVLNRYQYDPAYQDSVMQF